MTEVTIRIEEKKEPRRRRTKCECPACGGAGTIGYGLLGVTRNTCKKCKGNGWIWC